MKNTPSPAPGVAATEAAAKLIYETWSASDGYTPWQDGGNSFKQDEARKVAELVRTALQASAAAVPVAHVLIRDGRYDGFGLDGDAKLPDGEHKLYTAPPLPAQVQAAEVTDDEIIARCNAAGVHWLEPDGEEDGFPGGFDMSTMENMRKLLASRTPTGMAGGVGAECENCNQLVRALREATESPTFMGEPVLPPQPHKAMHKHWTHKSNPIDLYTVHGVCRLQMSTPVGDCADMVIYSGRSGLWVRPRDEFLDGRFHEAPGDTVQATYGDNHAVGLLEALLDIWDDGKVPYEGRTYESGALMTTFEDARLFLAAPHPAPAQQAAEAETEKAARMNIFSQRGEQVIFDAGGGYPAEIEHAKKALIVGGVYTVERTEVGGCSSSVFLKGIDRGWNTVMFAAIEAGRAGS